ncbi:mobilization protein [uncultured Jannaschia sp.]|uniref:mobilization protein n=1 Tax=uncultured Jannaschia sp. TaxID=293347 RepID=UPI0026298AF9|nr:mobilization protein [uncultured Jannaschia sp.]
MAETELERAEKRFAQAKARLQALKNREATKARKIDTRRKVILGGALMDLAERDSSAAAMVDRLLRNLPRDQDRAAFDGWTLGQAGDGGGAASAGSSATSAGDAGDVDRDGSHSAPTDSTFDAGDRV